MLISTTQSTRLNSAIGVALSNPCFELWVVLHHEDQTAHVDRRSIQQRAVDIGAMTGKTSIEHLEGI
ncbi:MAG: RloB domain-containing protein [Acidimicrobiia bacterium]|nr:RloB domain-containing protein [Acidimicrobiia bacterium]